MTNLLQPAPVADLSVAELVDDPFPVLARLRAEASVHWVPALGRYLVTGYDDCHRIELDQEAFSADEDHSLMKRSMGHSMLRKDDPEHAVERRAWQPRLRPGAIKSTWRAVFERTTERCLDGLAAAGPEADLVRDFAAPLAAENLRCVLGLSASSAADIQRWSQALIDATGNYADDPVVWQRGEEAYAEVDAALADVLPRIAEAPDGSLLAGLLQAGPEGYLMPLEAIRANMKMTIGGGVNEPRDVLTSVVWALLSDPAQLDCVRADPARWNAAFDEAIRWIAPIGMYPRQTTRAVTLGGVTLAAGARIGVVVLAANRDPRVFPDPDRYDLARERRPHLAFGGGAHYCAGAWVARTSIAEVALPRLFERFPQLQIDPDRATEISGWVFRGLTSLPVLLGPARSRQAVA